jgi:hypothetical protein
MQVSFQRHAAGKFDATYHFAFTGKESTEATVTVRDGKITVETGLLGQPSIKVIADSENVAWLPCGRAESFVGLADAPPPVAGKSEVAARFQTLFPIVTTAGQPARPHDAHHRQQGHSLHLHHDGPQGAKPMAEVLTDILAAIRERKA